MGFSWIASADSLVGGRPWHQRYRTNPQDGVEAVSGVRSLYSVAEPFSTIGRPESGGARRIREEGRSPDPGSPDLPFPDVHRSGGRRGRAGSPVKANGSPGDEPGADWPLGRSTRAASPARIGSWFAPSRCHSRDLARDRSGRASKRARSAAVRTASQAAWPGVRAPAGSGGAGGHARGSRQIGLPRKWAPRPREIPGSAGCVIRDE